jgi:hypothetical protein
VIRQQLQRQDFQQGADFRIRLGNDDQVIAVGAQAGILFADGDRARAAHFDFVDAADDERHIARVWPAWLKSAWPQAEVWAGWSEVRIPGLSVIPDALAWGRVQGYETLFWLEVGDEHRKRDKIIEITSKRLDQAWELCEWTGV